MCIFQSSFLKEAVFLFIVGNICELYCSCSPSHREIVSLVNVIFVVFFSSTHLKSFHICSFCVEIFFFMSGSIESTYSAQYNKR